MKVMCGKQSGLSKLGCILSLISVVTLSAAYLSGSWLFTKEPLPLEKHPIKTTVIFRIGLWRVCPSIRRINSTINVPSPACSMVKYSEWREITSADLGLGWTSLELTQNFINKMRFCTILCSAALILFVLAVFFMLLGHCNNDNKTILACGLFILGGLSLGCGLITFVSALTETLGEIYEYHRDGPAGPDYDYHYGWGFFTAGIALILTYMGSALIFLGHLNRYPSMDDMVREMVPGAERKLREHKLSTEYLIRPHYHPTTDHKQYHPITTDHHSAPSEPYEANECGPLLLNKTPPDVCTTNRCQEFADLSCAVDFCAADTLTPQTIPITIKNYTTPLNYSTNKYGYLGVSDLEATPIIVKSRTLQPIAKQRMTKKVNKIETFQVPETGFTKQRTTPSTTTTTSVGDGYSGSAV